MLTNIKKEFPLLDSQPDFIYLDNAATTQKPKAVLRAMDEYFTEYNANVNRGEYLLAKQATKAVENTRNKVASFMNANPKEIYFTSGTTESLALVARLWGMKHLKTEDEIIICDEDHTSTTSPWYDLQLLLAQYGIRIMLRPLPVTKSGTIDIQTLSKNINEHTKLVALTHIHNVFGSHNNISNIRNSIPQEVLISLDAAQSIGHIPIDIQTLGADFISFSGHKIFSAPGTGVLWVSERAKQTLPALEDFLERGTPNISGIISLGAAIEFITTIGIEKVAEHLSMLTRITHAKLALLPGIRFLPGYSHDIISPGYGILSFSFPQKRMSEIGDFLNRHNIAVRVGSHCLASNATITPSIRLSMQIYNTKEEIDTVISILKRALE